MRTSVPSPPGSARNEFALCPDQRQELTASVPKPLASARGLLPAPLSPWQCQRYNNIIPTAQLAVCELVHVPAGCSRSAGQGQPPKYGDYEAQRHWMEVTLHLPVDQWYAGGPLNDLSWWGLDYPPLTAYQSYAHGLILNASCPEAVALLSSRGYESPLRCEAPFRSPCTAHHTVRFFVLLLYF